MSDLAEQASAALAALPASIRATRASEFAHHAKRALLFERKGFSEQAESARAAAANALRPARPCAICGETCPEILRGESGVVICGECAADAEEFETSLRVD